MANATIDISAMELVLIVVFVISSLCTLSPYHSQHDHSFYVLLVWKVQGASHEPRCHYLPFLTHKQLELPHHWPEHLRGGVDDRHEKNLQYSNI